VVVGSAVVSRMTEHKDDAVRMTASVQEFVQGLRQAMDAARSTGA
jgi:tryptophan synthase alpha subunit